MLALIAHFNWELEQLDVKTAFLHGELGETIFINQPEGFEIEGKQNQVCLLKRSLYGLKQSPRQWYKRFDTFVTRAGFKRSNFDNCLYFRGEDSKKPVFLLLYVDDMLLTGQDMKEIQIVKSLLHSEFEMKDLGHAKKILGMNIFRDRKKNLLFLNQLSFIDKVLTKFSMQDAKVANVPLGSHFKLSSDQCPGTEAEKEDMMNVPYSHAIGSVMYMMVCTRPDLAHAISVLSRYMSNPGREH